MELNQNRLIIYNIFSIFLNILSIHMKTEHEYIYIYPKFPLEYIFQKLKIFLEYINTKGTT